MTYVPTNWVTGDVITAQKLNNMETGISGSEEIFGIDITATEDAETHVVSYATTKTYAAILAAINAGKVLDVKDNNGVSYTVSDITTSESGFVVKCSYSGTEFSGGACTLTVTTLTITGTASSSTVAITASTGTGGGGSGGSGEYFKIPITGTTDDEAHTITYSTTKTYSEIREAVVNNQPLFIYLSTTNEYGGQTIYSEQALSLKYIMKLGDESNPENFAITAEKVTYSPNDTTPPTDVTIEEFDITIACENENLSIESETTTYIVALETT